jgi:hypothetical protein
MAASTTTETKPKRQVFDHSKCSHPGTSKARKECREARAEAASSKPKAPVAKKAPAAPKIADID